MGFWSPLEEDLGVWIFLGEQSLLQYFHREVLDGEGLSTDSVSKVWPSWKAIAIKYFRYVDFIKVWRLLHVLLELVNFRVLFNSSWNSCLFTEYSCCDNWSKAINRNTPHNFIGIVCVDRLVSFQWAAAFCLVFPLRSPGISVLSAGLLTVFRFSSQLMRNLKILMQLWWRCRLISAYTIFMKATSPITSY